MTMEELCKIIKNKYKDFDITPQNFLSILKSDN